MVNLTGKGTDDIDVDSVKVEFAKDTGHDVSYGIQSSSLLASDLANSICDFAISIRFNDTANISNIPLLFSPIAIVYKLSGVKTLRLSSSTLAKIFAGQITRWNDPEIVAENTRMAKLLNIAITVLYPSSNMAETYGFTDYLHKTSSEIWTKWTNTASTSFSSAFPGTIPNLFQSFSSVSQATIATLKSTNGAITFMGLKEAVSYKLTTAYIKNSNNKYVKPTSATATEFISKAASISSTGEVTFDYAKMNIGVGYPIVAVYYGLRLTNMTNMDIDKKSTLEGFFEFLVTTFVKNYAYYAKTSGNNQTQILNLINKITNS